MKLAILGADRTTLALAKAAVERADLEIAYLCEFDQTTDPSSAELLRAVARSAKPLESWEALLDRQFVDGVIVARGVDDEHRSEQLRKFAQCGVPVLISHPVVGSMLIYYELDMIRHDTDALIMPALSDRLHPAISKLTDQMDFSQPLPIGKVEQVAIERQLADRSKEAVLTQFARDVDLLRFLCGELNQIGAMGTAGEESAFGNLSVQLTGPEGLLARWSVVPAEDSSRCGGRLTLTGAVGRATVEMTSDLHPWSLSSTTSTEAEPFPEWNRSQLLLKRFVRAIQAEPTDLDTADLLDAARAMELTETIGRSLARRRTIELHFEDHTEENTFKAKMAVGGCLLLMLGLGVLLLVTVFQKANIPGAWLWPWLLASVFGVFLLLQLLSLAFKK